MKILEDGGISSVYISTVNSGTVHTLTGVTEISEVSVSSASHRCLLNKLNGCDALHAVSVSAGGQTDFKDKFKYERLIATNKKAQA